ncbi:MAG: glycine cleavage system aminomethyltransferase GcvT [Parcubacteria group bacterium]|nr:glycine cleavage system aminomethyltransferase GcvT [Parcubacteria group bacterium]
MSTQRQTLRQTALHDLQAENGAKMGVFGDWKMPLSYGSEKKEYWAVREKAGLFDVSHMGIIKVKGADAEKFVQYMTTNDTSRLSTGNAQYNLICRQDGGINDDVVVYKVLQAPDTAFLFIVNASNTKKILAWFETWKKVGLFRVGIEEKRGLALLALQGPAAEEILLQLAFSHVPKRRYSFTPSMIYGSTVIISRTGYTGEDGFEIICPQGLAKALWEELLDCGETYGLLPCGLVARDMLRTEKGYRLYGDDIDHITNPIEAGLEKFVSLSKGDFIGKASIEKALALRNRGGGRCLQGFVMDTKTFPRHGNAIFVGAEVSIPDEFGVVTSATYSPSLKKRIVMGYVREKKNPGDIVWVKTDDGNYHPATVTALPFYSRKK